jgi:hypothetical protein
MGPFGATVPEEWSLTVTDEEETCRPDVPLGQRTSEIVGNNNKLRKII